jgi:hypothetical protein
MPFTNHYERSYGISLLDDLHNLFPEILYDPLRFQQNSLVQFVRERTAQLFDMEFARNRAYYRLYRQPQVVQPVIQPQSVQAFTIPITSLRTGEALQEYTSSLRNSVNLFTLLGSLGGLEGMGDLTPVPVIPTSQQIAQGSILSSIEPSADVVCAICQDHSSPNGHEWRILRSCTHRFHRHCIDTWFQRNVHCPVCRHDIRESNADV